MNRIQRIIILYPAEINSRRMSKPGNYSLSRLLLYLHERGDIPIYYLNKSSTHEQYGNIEFIPFTWINFVRLAAKFAFARNTLVISQMGSYAYCARLLRALMPGSRIVVRLGGVYYKQAYLDSAAFKSDYRKERRMVRSADMVISTADGTPVDLYMSKVGIPPARYRKWLNGFPTIPNTENVKRQNVIVCISRLHRGKLIDAVVRAFAMSLPRLHEQHRLKIVGDGEEKGNLEALVRELGIEGLVEFVGHSDDVGPHLYGSKLLVSGLTNNPVMEAIATGTPVVTAEWGEMRALYGAYPNVTVVDCPNLGFGPGPVADIDLLIRRTSQAIVGVLNAYPWDQAKRKPDGGLISWEQRILNELELCESLFSPLALPAMEAAGG